MKKTILALIAAGWILTGRCQKPGAAIDVDFYHFTIALHDGSDTIEGEARIDLRVLHDANSISLDLSSPQAQGKGMRVTEVSRSGKPLTFGQENDRLILRPQIPFRTGDQISLLIRYQGVPDDGLIISTNKYGQRTFFSDNWPDRAHHWLPCVDDPADKAGVEFRVTAPDHYQVISNGLLKEENALTGHLKMTRYLETVPLPTKVMVIGAAEFAIDSLGDFDSIALSSWVYPQEKEAGFYDYSLAREILPYFIDHVGPYAYRKLANVQSKTRFGGMENASAIFYAENSVKGDRKVEALLAHEIAHQWFGNSVTETEWKEIWLSEGFASYMAHLYLENKYGADSLRKRMMEDRKMVIGFSKTRKTPVVNSSVRKNYAQLLNPNSYQKGSWVLHMLRRKLGDSVFWKGIRHYYADFAGKNASTEDFREEMEKVSGIDLGIFFRQWLYRPGQPLLHVIWSYNTTSREISVNIEQLQSAVFEFPLTLVCRSGNDGMTASTLIKGRSNRFRIKYNKKPDHIQLDPDVNLLFELNGIEQK